MTSRASSTDDLQRPTRPVVPSLMGAMSLVNAWLRDHQYDILRDGDGQAWDLKVEVEERPDPNATKGGVCRVRVLLSTKVSAGELVQTKVLSPKTSPSDARLLRMIDEETVTLAMKPRTTMAASEDEARLWLADALPKLKAELAGKSLIAVKRDLIGRWIDERGRFGAEAALDP